MANRSALRSLGDDQETDRSPNTYAASVGVGPNRSRFDIQRVDHRQTVTLTAAASGAWTVKNPAGTSIVSGTGYDDLVYASWRDSLHNHSRQHGRLSVLLNQT